MALRRPGLIALFDVDGTLTAPRKVMTVGVVGGSYLAKISEQLAKSVVDDYDYMFAENGLVAYKDGKLIGMQNLKLFLGEEKLKLQEFINYTLHYIADLDIPIKRGHLLNFEVGCLMCRQLEETAVRKREMSLKSMTRFTISAPKWWLLSERSLLTLT